MGGTTALVVGNGAREHILAEALRRDVEIVAYMEHKNPGIARLATNVAIGTYENLNAITAFANATKPNFAVIGPEAPLALGVVDALEAAGVPCVGPKKKLAQLETSKAFTRELLQKYRIPGNPKFKIFTSMDGVSEWLDKLEEYVIKADGLHGGKGVKVSGAHLKNKEEALAYAQQAINSDGKIVIEEKLDGEEFSLMGFTDGTTVKNMPCVQDHKRAFENDEGPNTGGMGSYSDANHALPFLTEEDVAQAKHINEATCRALAKEFGTPYKGIMYGGFMATKNGVKLIEYNARFGDPEVMNLLTMLETPLAEICNAIVTNTLEKQEITFNNKATVCKYVVPEGYPTEPKKGKISVSEDGAATYYYGSVSDTDDGMTMNGSRAVAVVGTGDTISAAELVAEAAAKTITGDVFYRSDIGKEELVARRITHMKELR